MSNDSLDIIKRLRDGLNAVVLYRPEVKNLLLVTLLGRGHLLIEGLPGTGKTLLAKTFAHLIGGEFKRIQGTPDMLPADITGFYIYRPDQGPEFIPGPVFTKVLMVDELNRLSPRTQSALLEAMQEQQVTVEGHTHALVEPFMVIASQIPFGGLDTTALSEVQADRFMLRAWNGYPEFAEEDEVLKNIDAISEASVEPVVSAAELTGLQQAASEVHVGDGVRGYIISLVEAVRANPDVAVGPSPRASIALFRCGRALALISGRNFVIPDDIKTLAVTALHHRTRLRPEAESDGISAETVIRGVLDSVSVPKV